jgi:hypothetical protein
MCFCVFCLMQQNEAMIDMYKNAVIVNCDVQIYKSML